jgi:predicted porin
MRLSPAGRFARSPFITLAAATGVLISAVEWLPARAQGVTTPDIAALQRLVEQQAQQIQAMQRRLDQVERAQKAAGRPEATSPGLQAGAKGAPRPGYAIVPDQGQASSQLAAQPPVGGLSGPATNPQSINQAPRSPGTPQVIVSAPPVPARGTPALPVLSGNDKVKVTLSGQLDRDLIFHGDGSGKMDTYFADNNVSSTRIRALGSAQINDSITVVSALEFDLRSNSSSSITRQSVNNNGGDTPVIGPFRVRRAEIGVQSRDYGNVMFGRGSSFSDGIAEFDLSGTDIAIYSFAPDSWGGLQFADRTSPMRRPGDPSVSQVFDDFDGPRDDRLRYDTPSFHGLTFGATVGQGYYWDVGARYSAEINSVKIATGISYQNYYSTRPSLNTQDGTVAAYNPFSQRVAGSLAILLPNGLNALLSGGWGTHISECCTTFAPGNIAAHDGTTWFAKIGYRAHLIDLGTTNFSIDAGQTYNRIRDGDVATRVGFEVNQPVVDAGLELFLAYERLTLRRSGASFKPGDFALMGSRVQF